MQIQHQRATLAAMYCEIAERASDEKNIAIAALNYRRATIVAPNSEAGQAGARVIGKFQEDAQLELQAVDRLVATEQFDHAIERLNRLRRDYSALAIAPKIEQARRRVLRLQAASERVAEVEPRIGSDHVAGRSGSDCADELAERRDDQVPAGTARGTLASISNLAKQTRNDSAGPRIRGSDPSR